MAGYSKRSLIQKLGLKANSRTLLINAPKSFLKDLGDLPEGVKLFGPTAKSFDFGILFLSRAIELARIAPLVKRMERDGMLWLAWPKKTANPNSELSDSIVRRAGLDAGVVDVKVAAIDDYWSGLKFVYRLKDR